MLAPVITIKSQQYTIKKKKKKVDTDQVKLANRDQFLSYFL